MDKDNMASWPHGMMVEFDFNGKTWPGKISQNDDGRTFVCSNCGEFKGNLASHMMGFKFSYQVGAPGYSSLAGWSMYLDDVGNLRPADPYSADTCSGTVPTDRRKLLLPK